MIHFYVHEQDRYSIGNLYPIDYLRNDVTVTQIGLDHSQWPLFDPGAVNIFVFRRNANFNTANDVCQIDPDNPFGSCNNWQFTPQCGDFLRKLQDRGLGIMVDDSWEAESNYTPENQHQWNMMARCGVDLDRVIWSYGNHCHRGVWQHSQDNTVYNMLSAPWWLLASYYQFSVRHGHVDIVNASKPKYDTTAFVRRARPSKLTALAKMYQRGLLDRAQWTLCVLQPEVRRLLNDPEQYHCERDFVRSLGRDWNHWKSIQLDDDAVYGAVIRGDQYIFNYRPSWFENSKTSTVIETWYSQKEAQGKHRSFSNIIHITEKTYKALHYGHPFVMIGNQGTLSELHREGFETYSGIIDESYDDLDDQQRMDRALDQLPKLIDCWQSPEVDDRVLFNQQRMRSKAAMSEIAARTVIEPLADFFG